MTRLLALVLALGLLTAPVPADAARTPGGWCYGNHWGSARTIPHLRHQRQVARRALSTRDDRFEVKRARPTQLGVIALATGNLDAARARLRRLGVDHVISWTANYLSDFPPNQRMGVVIDEDFTRPVLDDIQAHLPRASGFGGFAFWTADAGVVLTWKGPLPPRVRAVGGTRRNGVEVRVVARPYSFEDERTAIDRLIDFLDRNHVDWSGVSPCHSDAGLQLDVRHPDRLSVTQRQIERAAGMRVLVGYGNAVATRASAAPVPNRAARTPGAWCTADHFGRPRPIPHDQRVIAQRARHTRDPRFEVKQAQATQVGVIALVTGDLAGARTHLHGIGVRHVYAWDHGIVGSVPPQYKMGFAIQDNFTKPLADRIDPRIRHLSGVELAIWDEDLAVVLLTKPPVSRRVRALAGVRHNGTEVRVVARRYSQVDERAATRRLIRFLHRHHVRSYGADPCPSDRGLDLLVPSLQDLSVSHARLNRAAGMRVLVEQGYVGGVAPTAGS